MNSLEKLLTDSYLRLLLRIQGRGALRLGQGSALTLYNPVTQTTNTVFGQAAGVAAIFLEAV